MIGLTIPLSVSLRGALMAEERVSQHPNLVFLLSIAVLVLVIFAWSFV